MSGVVIAFWAAAVRLLGAVLYKKARAARGDCASAAGSCGHRGRARLGVAIVALAMATAGSAGAPVRKVVHTGAGVARREAHHARRAEERTVLEEVDAEATVRAEGGTQKIVRVEAGSIVVEAEGANYAPVVKRESKKARRARQQQ